MAVKKRNFTLKTFKLYDFISANFLILMTYADIVFVLICVFFLPLTFGQTDRSCSCTGGMICDFKTIYCAPFDNGACRRENVALGKKATISSLFEAGNNQAENAACVAVNGNTNNEWLPLLRNPTTGNCIHTDPNQNGLLFWEVDLGKSYFITFMSLYPRVVAADRMKQVSILVDKAICYVFRISPYPQPYYKIECKPSLTGQKVRLEKPPFEQRYGIQRHDYTINVCELQVWVCRQGYYGPECDKECHPFCVSCDNINGECKGGCTASHFGPGCLQTCLTCVDYNCNDQGICQSSCETGFTGEKCDTRVTMEKPVRLEKYAGFGFLILALLTTCICYKILSVLRKKKEEEGGEEGDGGEGGEGGEVNVEALQETETPAAPENEEPVDQEAVEELNPNPESETKEEGNEQADQGEEQVAEPEVVPDE